MRTKYFRKFENWITPEVWSHFIVFVFSPLFYALKHQKYSVNYETSAYPFAFIFLLILAVYFHQPTCRRTGLAFNFCLMLSMEKLKLRKKRKTVSDYLICFEIKR